MSPFRLTVPAICLAASLFLPSHEPASPPSAATASWLPGRMRFTAYLPLVWRNAQLPLPQRRWIEPWDGDVQEEPLWRYPECTVRTETDDKADGKLDRVQTCTYRHAGAGCLLCEFDSEADGTIDSRHEADCDNEGNETVWRSDRDNDGQYDWVYYTYYNDRYIRTEDDGDNDGVIDTIWTKVFDEQHHLVASYHDYVRDDPEGPWDNATFYYYDDRYHIVEETEDLDLDGLIDSVRVYSWQDDLMVEKDSYQFEEWGYTVVREYDEHRRLVSQIIDPDEKITTYQYGEDGWLQTEEWYDKGKLRSWCHYIRDSLGRIVVKMWNTPYGPTSVVRIRYGCP